MLVQQVVTISGECVKGSGEAEKQFEAAVDVVSCISACSILFDVFFPSSLGVVSAGNLVEVLVGFLTEGLVVRGSVVCLLLRLLARMSTIPREEDPLDCLIIATLPINLQKALVSCINSIIVFFIFISIAVHSEVLGGEAEHEGDGVEGGESHGHLEELIAHTDALGGNESLVVGDLACAIKHHSEAQVCFFSRLQHVVIFLLQSPVPFIIFILVINLTIVIILIIITIPHVVFVSGVIFIDSVVDDFEDFEESELVEDEVLHVTDEVGVVGVLVAFDALLVATAAVCVKGAHAELFHFEVEALSWNDHCSERWCVVYTAVRDGVW